MPDLNAVVVSYRTPQDLDDFLQSWGRVSDEVDATLTVSLVAPLGPDHAVVASALSSYLDPSKVVIKVWDDNVGYNIACNDAASKGDAPYLALFNADVVLEPGVLSACVLGLEDNPDWAVVGPRQVNKSNLLVCAGTVGPATNPHLRGWLNYDRGQYSDMRDDVVHVAGSVMFWRRQMWDELTLCPEFQEAAPGACGAMLPTNHYWGESYAMLHARRHGRRVAYLGTVRCIHKWHTASTTGKAPHITEDQQFFRRACDIHGIEHD